MRGSAALCVLGVWMLLGAGAVWADDITGADHLLCSSMNATQCLADGVCTTGPLMDWGVPHFIEIDLEGKQISTTAASGMARSTPISTLEWIDHYLVIQAYQGERAFSMMVAEDTGAAAMAIVLEGQVLSIFGACTPHQPVG